MRYSSTPLVISGCIGLCLGAFVAWSSNDVFIGLPAAIMVAVAACWFIGPIGQR